MLIGNSFKRLLRRRRRSSWKEQRVSELSDAIRNDWLRQTFQARQSASPRKTVTTRMSAFIVWSPRSAYETFFPICRHFPRRYRDPILAMRAIHNAIQGNTSFGAVCRLLTEASTIRWIQEELLKELSPAELERYEALAQKKFGDSKIGLACAILLKLPPHKAAACAVAVRGERFIGPFPSLRSVLEEVDYDKERKKWLALPKPESLSSEHSKLLPACQRLWERAAHLPFRKFVKEILKRRLEKGALEIWDILKEGWFPAGDCFKSSVLSLLKKRLHDIVSSASDRETILQLLEGRTNLGREEQQVGLAYLMVILLAPHIVATLAVVVKHRLAQYKTLFSAHAAIKRT